MDRLHKFDMIIERVDPDELVDVLGLSTEQLFDLLFPIINANLERFEYVFGEAEAAEELDAEEDGEEFV